MFVGDALSQVGITVERLYNVAKNFINNKGAFDNP